MTRRFVIEKEGRPDLPGMMLATIETLKAIGDSATIQELDEQVIEMEDLWEEEQSYPMPSDENRLKVSYYLAWARTYLKRGDALDNSARGVWSLTEVGSAITSRDQTEAIRNQINEEEKARAKFKRQLASEKKKKRDLKKLPQKAEQLELLIEAAEFGPEGEDDWKSVLLAVVRNMEPDAFERLTQRLLREAGFTKVEVRGKTGDGGIDGVGSKEIRDFRGALLGRADNGLFITTGRFTSSANDEATRDGAIAIDLIDGDRLCDLLKENRLGVSTEMIEQVHIDGKWFLSV